MSDLPESAATDAPPQDEADELRELRELRESAVPSPLSGGDVAAPERSTQLRGDEPPPARTYPGTRVPLSEKLESARMRRGGGGGRGRGRKGKKKGPRSTDGVVDAGQHPLIRDLMLNPGPWHIWPAVAVLRWMLRHASSDARRLMYRSKPSLDFPPGEVEEVELTAGGIVGLVLRAPGIAAPGSPLPTSDILRIMQDQRRGGALATWLDGFGDRFMQAVETAQAQNNVAFALATGGEIPTLRAASHLVGNSAPLASDRNAVLSSTWTQPPRGALGLAPFFCGPISASKLIDLVEAFTSVPVRVVEFAGATVAVARPSRIGIGAFGAMLGVSCTLASAGVEVILEGGDDANALKWAREPSRRRSLYTLSGAFIGAPSPVARFYLEIDAAVVPAAALDEACFGGLAVLGTATGTVRVPLANG